MTAFGFAAAWTLQSTGAAISRSIIHRPELERGLVNAVTAHQGKGSAMEVSSNADLGGKEARLLASLDQSKFTTKHWWLYAALTLTHLTDGFDLLMIGVVLPGI